MNRESALKIQAYVDGELSGRDRAKIERLLDQEPSAQALASELKSTQQLLAAHEPQYSLPESKDFFWSKISRGINRAAAAPAAPARWSAPGWLRWTIPAATCALIVSLFLLAKLPRTSPLPPSAPETEVAIADTSGFAFNSETDGMSVVWVQSDGN
jgi:anti-sigma factor RsiW